MRSRRLSLKGTAMDRVYFILPICSLLIAALTAVIAVGVALPMAYFLYRYHFRGKSLYISLLYLCSIMPTKVAALAVAACYNVLGFPALCLSFLLLNIPFAALLLRQAHARIDSVSLLVAAGLGRITMAVLPRYCITAIAVNYHDAMATIFVVCFCSVSFSMILGTHRYHNTPDYMMPDWRTKQGIYQHSGGMGGRVWWCFLACSG